MRVDAETSLERALGVWLAWQTEVPRRTPDELVSSHPELAEHLTALLADRGDAELAADAEGTQLGGYRLLRELGRGGMGVVHEAIDLALERRVALKLLPPAFAGDPSALARFKREAHAVARLDHPGIVRVLGVGSSGDTHWFAMELVDGGPLTLHAPRGLRERVTVIAEIAQALAHAHAQGILHRDVKPSNILLRSDGRAVLTDFGLARLLADPGLTRTGGFLGTPAYASPEQARGVEVDARSDVFSLGSTMYELLSGRRPFEGADAATIIHRILREEPPDLQRIAPAVGRDLAAIVAKSLEKDPARRYVDMQAFANDLCAWLAGAPVQARPLGPIARGARWAQREPWRAAAVAALALGIPLVAGLAGYQAANAPVLAAGQHQLLRVRVDQQLNRGFLAVATEDYAGARAAFAATLELVPAELDAWIGAALARLEAGDPAAAAELLAQAPPVVRAAPALQRVQASILRGSGRLPEADALEAQLGPPAAAPDLFAAGLLELRRWRDTDDADALRRAAQWLRRAVETSPAPRPSYHFQLLYATTELRQAEPSAGVAAAIAQLWPQEWAAQRELARWEVDLDPGAAVARLEELLARAPAVGRHWIAYDLGLARERSRDVTGAIAAYRKAVEAEPAYGKAWNNLGRQLAANKQHDEAVEAYRTAIRLDPSRAKLQMNLGISLRALGDVTGAEAAYREALRLHPPYARAHFNLGNLLRDRGELTEAAAAFRAAAQSDPSYVRAFGNLAVVLSELDDHAGAVEACRRAIALAPRDLPPYVNLGWSLQRLGDWAGARKALETGVSIAPAHAIAWRSLARCLSHPDIDARVADPALALVAARRAAALLEKPDRFTSLAIAEAHAQLGNRAAGEAALAEAAALFAAETEVWDEDERRMELARARLQAIR